MNLLICGGRNFHDNDKLVAAMHGLPFTPDIVVQGGARGADTLGKMWAIRNGVHYATVPALWDAFGKSAGGRRNSAMLLLNIGYCLAMPGGTGTADMVKKCQAAGVTTWLPYGA